VTGRVGSSNPDATVSATIGDGVTASVPRSINIALTDLAKNAVEHNDSPEPWIRVRVEETAETVELEVADDGPGIPANELDVLTNGTETPLKHGSGIGFWPVHWIVTQAGGSLAVRKLSPAGSVVTVTLPLDSG
jgi:signal transduction histidine kinase